MTVSGMKARHLPLLARLRLARACVVLFAAALLSAEPAAATTYDCDPSITSACGSCWVHSSTSSKVTGNTVCAQYDNQVCVTSNNDKSGSSTTCIDYQIDSACNACTGACNTFFTLCANAECIGDWSSWSSCSSSCGSATRTRTWVLEATGVSCSYSDGETETDTCSLGSCPANCVGAWGSWGDCDCATSLKTRTYSVISEASSGGVPCDADEGDTFSALCSTSCCDGDNDNVCDTVDSCPDDSLNDGDLDGLCDGVDSCPDDDGNDSDDDGLCSLDDLCPLDGANDADTDLICGDVDSCPYDSDNDADSDARCGDVDSCPLDAENDIDGDLLCGNLDSCPNDAENDADADLVCGNDDSCPYDSLNDIDSDLLCAQDDSCPFDAANDVDSDTLCAFEHCLVEDMSGRNVGPYGGNCASYLSGGRNEGYCVVDGICDVCKCSCATECGTADPCVNDAENDADGDGLCADVDPCPYNPLNTVDGFGTCIEQCPPGTYGGATCTACPAGQFQPNYTLAATSCSNHSVTACDVGFHLNPGTATTDGTCIRCREGTFQPFNTSNATACTEETFGSCGVGFYFVDPGGIADTECVACPEG